MNFLITYASKMGTTAKASAILHEADPSKTILAKNITDLAAKQIEAIRHG